MGRGAGLGGGFAQLPQTKGGATGGPDIDGLKCDEIPEVWASGSPFPVSFLGRGLVLGPRQHMPPSCAPGKTRLPTSQERAHTLLVWEGVTFSKNPARTGTPQGRDSVFRAVRGQEGGVLVSPGPLPGLQPCCESRWKRCRETFGSPAKACPQNPWDWRVWGLGGGDGSRHPCKLPVLPCGSSQEHFPGCAPQALGFPGQDTGTHHPHRIRPRAWCISSTERGAGGPWCRQLHTPTDWSPGRECVWGEQSQPRL